MRDQLIFRQDDRQPAVASVEMIQTVDLTFGNYDGIIQCHMILFRMLERHLSATKWTPIYSNLDYKNLDCKNLVLAIHQSFNHYALVYEFVAQMRRLILRCERQMVFGKKKNWDEQYDEDYAARADRRERLIGSMIWLQLLGFFVVVAVGLALVYLVFGRDMFEKVAIALANPVGVVWLILLFQSYLSLLFRQTWFALISIAGWMVLTVFGNSFVANRLVYGLEKSYLHSEIDELPTMEVAFLLGGGTNTNLGGRAQAANHGDRVVTAARLFHDGKVKTIVCTGEQSFRTNIEDLDPREEAVRILESLEVPDPSIAMIRGKNTFEEMQNVSLFLEQQDLAGASFGIITSAWHMDRVARLAQVNGLNPILIPCDFRSAHFTNGPNLVVPSADNLATSAQCIKEHLASIVGR